MRTDKKKNVTKVLRSIIKNPLQTQEEIAKDVWLWEATVSRAIKEVEAGGRNIDNIIDFVKSDLEMQSLIQKEIKNRIINNPNDIKDADLKGYAEFAFKRSQILWWWATERKEINIVSDTQARLLASIIISDENLLTN